MSSVDFVSLKCALENNSACALDRCDKVGYWTEGQSPSRSHERGYFPDISIMSIDVQGLKLAFRFNLDAAKQPFNLHAQDIDFRLDFLLEKDRNGLSPPMKKEAASKSIYPVGLAKKIWSEAEYLGQPVKIVR
jgi:hypothetical protein